MPETELHIGKVSKPRLSPETIYDVEYTQTLPSNPILIYAPYTVSAYEGDLTTLFVSVNSSTFRDTRLSFYRTDVEILSGDVWSAGNSTKVGAQREIRWTHPSDPDVYITMITLTGIFPSNYANWDFISDPKFGMTCNWRSYLVYDYVVIESIPDENTRQALTQDDIHWTDTEGPNLIAWIYVVETNTLWMAMQDPYAPSTDPPIWIKHTEGIIIDFPTGVSRKRQCIARYQAIPGSNDGNKAPISYRGMIQNPVDGTVTEISGSSIQYTVNNSPAGAVPAFVAPPSHTNANGDMHGTVTMTETPVT